MTNELTVVDNPAIMPAMNMATAIERRNLFVQFVKDIMVENRDYGKVPGTDKPTLLKPGAEKLSTFFGLTPVFEIVEQVADWDRPLFHYQYKCKLYKADYLVGEGVGSCNSLETKYRWRWVGTDDLPPNINPDDCLTRISSISEFKFAIEKAETTGQYGKPQEYWDRFNEAIETGEARSIKRMTRNGKQLDAYEIASVAYRVSNEEVYSQINTIDKMAQKRALVAAVLVAVNASEFFTQDLEDFDFGVIETTTSVVDVETGEVIEPPKPKPTNGKPKPTSEPPPPSQNGGKQDKPYQFQNSAQEKFWNEVQARTDGYYKNAWQMLQVIGGWFKLDDGDEWDARISLAVDHTKNGEPDPQDALFDDDTSTNYTTEEA